MNNKTWVPATPTCLKHLDVPALRDEARRFTLEETFDALLAADCAASVAERRVGLSQRRYRLWRNGRDVWPSSDVITLWSGSWIAACKKAGVVPAGLGNFAETRIHEALSEAFDATAEDRGKRRFTRADYIRWRDAALLLDPDDRRRAPAAVVIPSQQWVQYCVEAGLAESEVGKNRRPKLTSDDMIVQHLRRASDEIGVPLPAGKYRRWASQNQASSLSTVQNRFGSWSEAAKAAGVS